MEDFLKTLAELTALNTGTSSVVAVKTVFTSNEPPAFVAQALIKGMPSGWKLQRLDETPAGYVAFCGCGAIGTRFTLSAASSFGRTTNRVTAGETLKVSPR